MRRQLVSMFAAVSMLVALAFAIPLAVLISRTAEDRALDAARADVSAVTPVLAAGGSQRQVGIAVTFTDSGLAGRMTVVTTEGWQIGAVVTSPQLDEALAAGASHIGPFEGGIEVIGAVATGPDALSAVRVFVPDSALRQGRTTAWLALAAVTVTLVGIAVFTADRLARGVVLPTTRLAAAARRLGAGELDARVEPEGPSELIGLGKEINSLGARISTMLDHERELVAELSHRLRTPLTTLRLRLDQVDDQELAARLRADVDDVATEVTAVIQDARRVSAAASPIDAVACVKRRADHWAVLAEDQGRPWTTRLADGPGYVAVRDEELSAALDALIDNVFSHTPDGTAVSIEIDVTTVVTVTVSDAGPGLVSDSVEPGVSGAESTGLGMAIARRTAQAAGGKLRIGTGDLGGAAVSLEFPRVTSA